MLNWLKEKKYFFVLYIFFILVTQIPFRFPSSDQSETLPVIINNLDPTIFSEDWFVSASQENNYRLYFIHLMSFLGGYLELKYAYFLMTILVTFFSFLAIYLIASEIFHSQRTALITVFFSMFLPNIFSLFNQQLVDHNLLPRSISTLFFLFSLLFYLKKQYLAFFAFLILSIPFHLMQAAYFNFCLLFSHLMIFRRIRFPIVTALISLLMSILFFGQHILNAQRVLPEVKGEIFEAMTVIRNPNLSSLFHLGLSNILFQFILVSLFIAGLKKGYSLKERQMIWIIPGGVILSVFQYILVDILHSYYGAFFYSRSLMLVNFVLILFIANTLSLDLSKSRLIISSIFFPVLFSMSILYSILFPIFKEWHWLSKKLIIAIGIATALVTSQVYYCLISTSCFDLVKTVQWWSPIFLIGAIYMILSQIKWQVAISTTLIMVFVVIQLSFSPVSVISPILESLKAAAQNSIVLSPPELSNEVLFLANRSVVLNFDVMPSNPQGIREWRTRLFDLTNNRPFSGDLTTKILQEGYDSLTKEQVINLAQKYDATLFISRKAYECPLIKRAGSLYLYNLSSCVTSAFM